MKFFLLILLISITTTVDAQFRDDYQINSALSNVKVTDINSDNKYIWVTTDGNGIFRITKSTNQIKNYSTSNGNIKLDYFYCLEVNNRFVWAGSTDGLFLFDKRRGKWSKRKFGQGGQLGNWIRSLEYDKYENVLWIGRFMFLTKLNLKSRRFKDYDLTVNENQKSNNIKTIEVDGDSLVWFGTEAGLHKYNKSFDLNDKSALKFYDNRLNYFNGDGDQVSISDILFEQKNIWIGTDEFKTLDKPNYNVGGLYMFDRFGDWTKYALGSGLNGNGIKCIERTGNYLWISTYQFSEKTKEQYGRGLTIFNLLTKKFINFDNSNLPSTISTLHFDGNNIWLGSTEGLFFISLTNNLTILKK